MFSLLWGFYLFHINHSACLGAVCAQTLIIIFCESNRHCSPKLSLVCARPPLICSAPDDGYKETVHCTHHSFTRLISSSTHTCTHTHKKVVIYWVIHGAPDFILFFLFFLSLNCIQVWFHQISDSILRIFFSNINIGVLSFADKLI